jgi:hypothetical protein
VSLGQSLTHPRLLFNATTLAVPGSIGTGTGIANTVDCQVYE